MTWSGSGQQAAGGRAAQRLARTSRLPATLTATRGGVFFAYAAMCVVSFVFVAAVVPETRGKTLEEIERRWMRPGPLETPDG